MPNDSKKPVEMAGRRFGKWQIVAEAERRHGRDRWLCRCDCGAEHIRFGASLRTGDSLSCGCSLTEISANREWSLRRVYQCFADMHRRCSDPMVHNFAHYGGRGISVCAAWKEFGAFKDWAVSNGYSDDLTIDRIDAEEDYSPNNCRWVDRRTQTRNRRLVAKDPNGVPWPDIANAHGISVALYGSRVARGWPHTKAATLPNQRSRSI